MVGNTSLRLFLPLAVLTACSGSDPLKQVETAQSWTATSILVGERWLNRSVRDGYASGALRNASDELLKVGIELRKTMPNYAMPRRDSIMKPILAAASIAAGMAREVESRNSPAFSLQLDSLRAAARDLERVAPEKAP